ncbi:hypothetical protein KCU62_g8, partial [Aureobasidium sp. EXF-3399]
MIKHIASFCICHTLTLSDEALSDEALSGKVLPRGRDGSVFDDAVRPRIVLLGSHASLRISAGDAIAPERRELVVALSAELAADDAEDRAGEVSGEEVLEGPKVGADSTMAMALIHHEGRRVECEPLEAMVRCCSSISSGSSRQDAIKVWTLVHLVVVQMLEKLVESRLHIDRHIRLLELVNQWCRLFVVRANVPRDMTRHDNDGDGGNGR